MSRSVRITKKSRMVAEFVNAIVDLEKDGFIAMTKSQMVSTVVTANIGEEASTAIKTMLADELANELERYFLESVREAAEVIGRPYHMVTMKYFKQNKMAKSKYTMQQQVSVFGNGSSKAAGVRFVPEGVKNDPMLLLTLEKKMAESQSIMKSVEAQVEREIISGAVTVDRLSLEAK